MGPAFCIWSDTSRAHSNPLCNAWKNTELEIYFWTLSTIHCLGHFYANCVFSPLRKVLTVLYLTEYPVLWFIGPFLPAWHSTQKNLSTIPELLNLRLRRTPRSSWGDINFGRILLGDCSARHWWNCYTKGILKLIFSMKPSQISHFLFPSLSSFVVLFCIPFILCIYL